MIEVSSPFLPAAHKSFCHIWFLCWHRACCLSWRSGVVLHDSEWLVPWFNRLVTGRLVLGVVLLKDKQWSWLRMLF